ncbi:MAG: hypothetical protein H8E21_12670 [Gammaproteobacteria bacterium]|nr:hypothetical protein [Gammaproteobacteria bacterium]
MADAETYFGLSLAYMRKGLIEQAMQSIASAVLLDPQRSMYLSYWGKMLHQIGRNDKALTVLDSAIRLDQQDPTPRLYKAIILRDLNRPGEAIRHLQVAQELNNNRGVYRSRSLLDKDLAVQNVDLSRLFTQLGLAEWAHKKAINSIKSDFTNVSAHILNAGAYAGVGDRAYALANEALLARLMQPANINAFSSFNSYTSLYETPDNEFNLELSAGNHQQRSASLIAAGAVPEKSLAWSVAAVHDGSDGWRNTNGESFDNLSFIGKWQLNEKANLLISASVTDSEFMYDFNLPRYEIDSTDDNKPPFNIGTKELELGLHYRLSNDHDLMFYISGNDFNGGQNGLEIDPFNIGASILTLETVYKDSYERPSTRFQFQGIKKLKQHQLIYGLLFYNGMNNAHINEDATIYNPDHTLNNTVPTLDKTSSFDLDISFSSLYIQDSWQIAPNLLLDLAAYLERMDNANAQTGGEWSLNENSARFGLVWNVNSAHTLRFASFEYLLPFISARLDPTDIAGIPIFKNTNEGSLVTESDLVWDFEWNSGLLSTAIFKVQESFTSAALVAGNQLETTSKSEKQGMSITLNTLLGLSTGLNVGFTSFDVEDGSLPALDRKENNISIGLTHVYPNSLSVGAKHVVREMNFDGTREEGNINVTSLLVGYEFDNKKQQFEFEVSNLFDQKFNWVTDKFSTSGVAPERLFTARYRVSF